jgi:hypothetical protein
MTTGSNRIIGKIHKISGSCLTVKSSPLVYLLPKNITGAQMRLLDMAKNYNWDVHLYVKEKLNPLVLLTGFSVDKWKNTRKQQTRRIKAMNENANNLERKRGEKMNVTRGGFHTSGV